MKLNISVLLFCVFITSSLARKQFKNECLQEVGLTHQELKQSKQQTENKPEKVQCYEKCMLLKMGIIDEEGIIQTKNLPSWKREELTTCLAETETVEKCSDAEIVNKCFRKLWRPKHAYINREKFMENVENCKAELSINEDFRNLHNNSCFQKCMLEKNAAINTEGIIQEKSISGIIETFPVNRDSKLKILECVQEIEKVETCEDAMRVNNCFTRFLPPPPPRGQFMMHGNHHRNARVCLNELSLRWEDLRLDGNELEEESENKLCFHKCLLEKQGVINAQGVVQVDDLNELIILPPMAEEKKPEIIECISGVGTIKECADSTKIHDCFKITRRN